MNGAAILFKTKLHVCITLVSSSTSNIKLSRRLMVSIIYTTYVTSPKLSRLENVIAILICKMFRWYHFQRKQFVFVCTINDCKVICKYTTHFWLSHKLIWTVGPCSCILGEYMNAWQNLRTSLTMLIEYFNGALCNMGEKSSLSCCQNYTKESLSKFIAAVNISLIKVPGISWASIF